MKSDNIGRYFGPTHDSLLPPVSGDDDIPVYEEIIVMPKMPSSPDFERFVHIDFAGNIVEQEDVEAVTVRPEDLEPPTLSYIPVMGSVPFER